MKRKFNHYKLIFIFILSSTLILGIYIIITESTRAEINLVSKQKEILVAENKKLEELIRAERDILKQSEKIKVELNHLQESLPAEAKEDKFIKEIKKLLDSNEISLKEIRPEVSLEETEGYQSLSYQFKLKGEYQDYLSFLSELKGLNRLISIKQVLLKDDAEQLLIKMIVRIYYKRADKDV